MEMNPPPGTWHSPFSNCSLNGEDPVRELVLNAVAKNLMVGLLNDEAAEVQMGPDAIAIHAPVGGFRDVIFTPREAKVFRQTENNTKAQV
jgi:hypothetical protein